MIIYAICLVLGLMFTLVSAFLGHLFGGHDSVGIEAGISMPARADGIVSAKKMTEKGANQREHQTEHQTDCVDNHNELAD